MNSIEYKSSYIYYSVYITNIFQIKSIKSLYCHITTATSALVSEILMSVLQTVQKNNRQFTYGQTVQKNNNSNLHMDRQCKKKTTGQFTYGQTVQKNNNNSNLHMDRQCKKQQQFTYGQTVQKNNSNLHMDRQCKKTALEHLQCSRQCKKNTTTAIYIWTDSAKKQQFTYGQTVQKNNSNLHMDRQCKKQQQFTYGQTVQKTTAIYIWTDSAKKQQQFTYGQTVQKNNRQFTYGQTVQKKTTDNLHMDRQCKKTTDNLPMDRQCKKTTDNLPMDRQCKKTQQQQFTYGQTVQKTTAIYIWTVNIYRLYRRQCAKYTYIYSVHIVYYKDIIINDTLYTVWAHLHYVQYLYIM